MDILATRLNTTSDITHTQHKFYDISFLFKTNGFWDIYYTVQLNDSF